MLIDRLRAQKRGHSMLKFTVKQVYSTSGQVKTSRHEARVTLAPERPGVQGPEEGGVPGSHPAAAGIRTGSRAGSLEACALAPEPL